MEPSGHSGGQHEGSGHRSRLLRLEVRPGRSLDRETLDTLKLLAPAISQPMSNHQKEFSMNLEELFVEYWKGSFPTAPANKQSAASHVAFAKFVLEKSEQDQAKALTEDTLHR